MQVMKDIMGNPLEVGDKVATTYRGYADLTIWEVIGSTDQKIKLQKGKDQILKFPNQICLAVG